MKLWLVLLLCEAASGGVQCFVEQAVDLGGFDVEGAGQFGQSGGLLAEESALGFHLSGGDPAGHVGAVAVAAFEQSLGGEAFVNAEDGVLVDGQLAGQGADGGEAVAGLELPAGALGPDLGGNLPGDRHAGGGFDVKLRGGVWHTTGIRLKGTVPRCLQYYNSILWIVKGREGWGTGKMEKIPASAHPC
jgi:hypothetical protein